MNVGSGLRAFFGNILYKRDVPRCAMKISFSEMFLIVLAAMFIGAVCYGGYLALEKCIEVWSSPGWTYVVK